MRRFGSASSVTRPGTSWWDPRQSDHPHRSDFLSGNREVGIPGSWALGLDLPAAVSFSLAPCLCSAPNKLLLLKPRMAPCRPRAKYCRCGLMSPASAPVPTSSPAHEHPALLNFLQFLHSLLPQGLCMDCSLCLECLSLLFTWRTVWGFSSQITYPGSPDQVTLSSLCTL